MNPITFPGLGLTFHIQRVAFQIFGKDIYWYGIIIAAGFLLAARHYLCPHLLRHILPVPLSGRPGEVPVERGHRHLGWRSGHLRRRHRRYPDLPGGVQI